MLSMIISFRRMKSFSQIPWQFVSKTTIYLPKADSMMPGIVICSLSKVELAELGFVMNLLMALETVGDHIHIAVTSACSSSTAGTAVTLSNCDDSNTLACSSDSLSKLHIRLRSSSLFDRVSSLRFVFIDIKEFVSDVSARSLCSSPKPYRVQ